MARRSIPTPGTVFQAVPPVVRLQPWLAVSPKPINGDRHFEPAPMLWHRWDELADNVRFGVRRRFYGLVDAAGLDEDLARAYAIVRVVREATRHPANLTTFVALAKAIQD